MIYDVIIIGGGPAGVAAGIYAARKHLKTILLTGEFGGQSIVSPTIENWIGEISISGQDLAQKMQAHLEHQRGEFLEIVERAKVSKVEKTTDGFKVIAEDGQSYGGKTVLVCTGSHRRKLTVPGAKEYEQKGITYCATCDAPLFAGQDVAVIGGGNAGFGTASQLILYAKSVTIIEQTPVFCAEKITVAKILADPKVTSLVNVKLLEIKGDKFVNSLTYQDADGQTHELPVTGIFVEIGHEPETAIVQGLVETNKTGAIVADPRTGRTSVEGIWAAGDNTDMPYHQNNIAVSQGIIALEDIYNYLLKK